MDMRPRALSWDPTKLRHEVLKMNNNKSQKPQFDVRDIFFIDNRILGKYVVVRLEFGPKDVSKNKIIALWDTLTAPEDEGMGLPLPKLAISVTGGAKSFSLNHQLEQSFKRGIRKVVTSTDAWLITGGTNTGVMKLVAESIKDYNETKRSRDQIVALGIATLNTLVDADRLQDAQEHTEVQYNSKGEEQSDKCYLDSNHNHFILVDGNQGNAFGQEIGLRAAFEDYMANCSKDSTEGGKNIPVVQISVEGGPGTVETVVQTLEKGIPVILIKHSGRATDALVKAVQCYRKNGSSALEDFISTNSDLKTLRGTNMLPIFIKSIDKSLITIYNFHENIGAADGFSDVIFEALAKGEDGQDVKHRLSLALDWCQYEKAKVLLAEHPNIKDRGRELMLSALKQNKPDFVKLFRNAGIDILDLTIKELYDIRNSFLEELWTMKQFSSMDRHRKAGELISTLLKGQVKNLYTEFLYNILILPTVSGNQTGAAGYSFDDQTKLCNFKRPFVHLMIWAVLYNCEELAEEFWITGVDNLASAVIAASLSKALVKQSQLHEEDKVEQIQQRITSQFEQHAIGITQEGFHSSKGKISRLLQRPVFYTSEDGGFNTALSLADSAELMDFMSQAACQYSLNGMWYSYIDRRVNKLLLLLAVNFPPFVTCVKMNKNFDPTEGEKKINRKNDKDPSYRWSCWEKTKRFYNTPVVKFTLYNEMYLFFLLIFSYFLMVHLAPYDSEHPIQWTEILVVLWIIAFFVDELRQIVSSGESSTLKKFVRYWEQPWNFVDVFCLFCFVTTFILRFCGPDVFEVARSFYCITYTLYFIRFLQTFYFSEVAGPKIIMIRKMMADLLFFIGILLVFIICWGVIAQTIRYPETSITWETIKAILYMPYFQMYGEFDMGELYDPDIECNPDEVCMNNSEATVIFFIIYMLIVAVLLLNLLIAMFSYTFQTVQDNSRKVWQFYRYELFFEYKDKPWLPPPFSMVAIIITLFVNLCTKRKSYDEITNSQMEEYQRLSKDERVFTEDYYYGFKDSSKEETQQSKELSEIKEIYQELHKMQSDIMAKVQEIRKLQEIQKTQKEILDQLQKMQGGT